MTEEREALHRRMRKSGRRNTAAVVLAGLALVALGWMLNALTDRADAEQRRAETAVSGAEQLCQQVRQLGGACVVDPSTLRGDPGPEGPAGPPGIPGRPPTTAEIAVAVINYLSENPPEPGQPGKSVTPEQVTDAVRAYLTANPPQPGPKGEQGPGPTADQIADAVEAYLASNPLPTCPPGAHIEEYQPPLDERTFLVCTKDEG